MEHTEHGEFTDVLLTITDAAKLLKVSESTLNNWRARGKGPAFVKLGGSGSVRYPRKWLNDWLASSARAPGAA